MMQPKRSMPASSSARAREYAKQGRTQASSTLTNIGQRFYEGSSIPRSHVEKQKVIAKRARMEAAQTLAGRTGTGTQGFHEGIWQPRVVRPSRRGATEQFLFDTDTQLSAETQQAAAGMRREIVANQRAIQLATVEVKAAQARVNAVTDMKSSNESDATASQEDALRTAYEGYAREDAATLNAAQTLLVQAQQAQATASAQTAAAEQQLKALGAQLDAVRSNLLKKEIAVGVVVLVGGLYALARARPEWVSAIRARFQRQ